MADVYKTLNFQNVNQDKVLLPTRRLSSIGGNRLQSAFLSWIHTALFTSQ